MTTMAVPTATSPVVQIRHVSKQFGRAWALTDISADILPGSVVALFGPNGAGKSTLLRILATLSRPSKGQVTIGGLDVVRDAVAVRSMIGVVGHQSYLYPDLTAMENLLFHARLHGLTMSAAETRAADLAEQVGLSARLQDRVRTYSRGMVQRLALARALLPQPDLLLLDEPESGLDALATQALIAVLRQSGTRTVIISTHDVALGLDIATSALVLMNGRVRLHCLTDGLPQTEFSAWYRSEIQSAQTNAW